MQMPGRIRACRCGRPTWPSARCCRALYVLVPPFAGSGPVMNLLGLSPRGRDHRRRPALPARVGAALALVRRRLRCCSGSATSTPTATRGCSAPRCRSRRSATRRYVLVYPALMAGLLMLVRRRNPERDRAGVDRLADHHARPRADLVDRADRSRTLHDDELSTVAKLVSIAYPIGDILLLAAAIRLAVDARHAPAGVLPARLEHRRPARDRLRLRPGDARTAPTTARSGSTSAGSASTCCGARRRCTRRCASSSSAAPERDARLTPLRLRAAHLRVADRAGRWRSLQDIDEGDDRFVVNVAAIILFGLVVARMAGLVRQQERSVARERILSAAGAELVAATSRDGDLPRRARRRARARRRRGGRPALPGRGRPRRRRRRRARRGTGPSAPATADRAARTAARTARAVRLSASALDELRFPPTSASTLLLPLSVRGETHGLLAIAGETRIPEALQSSLAALATQVSLALESAALTEEVHRRTSEARFGSLVQHSSDLITVLDADRPRRLPEPLDRARARLHARRGRRHPLRPAPAARRGGAAPARPGRPDGPRGRRHRGARVRARATATAACASSRSSTPTCSTTRTSAASCSTAATSASARPSRSSSPTRPSTTP